MASTWFTESGFAALAMCVWPCVCVWLTVSVGTPPERLRPLTYIEQDKGWRKAQGEKVTDDQEWKEEGGETSDKSSENVSWRKMNKKTQVKNQPFLILQENGVVVPPSVWSKYNICICLHLVFQQIHVTCMYPNIWKGGVSKINDFQWQVWSNPSF